MTTSFTKALSKKPLNSVSDFKSFWSYAKSKGFADKTIANKLGLQRFTRQQGPLFTSKSRIVNKLQVSSLPIAETVFRLLKDIRCTPTCPVCGNSLDFISLSQGYRSYCSRKCSFEEAPLHYEKAKATNLAKYGSEYLLNTDRAKAKYTKTCLRRYGKSSYLGSKDFLRKATRTWTKKYGVPSPMQNANVSHKALVSCRTKFLKIGAKVFTLLQGYEPQAIQYLVDVVGVDPTRIVAHPKISIPYFCPSKKTTRYYSPDIQVGNTIIEVKSLYTYDGKGLHADKRRTNDAKLLACRKLGYKTKLMVMMENGELLFKK